MATPPFPPAGRAWQSTCPGSPCLTESPASATPETDRSPGDLLRRRWPGPSEVLDLGSSLVHVHSAGNGHPEQEGGDRGRWPRTASSGHTGHVQDHVDVEVRG